ncbi:BLUF domain-containing protein [Octadecabacter sp. G9-8]|uniref:BLUF domain-containing protein n=1 Tax=Octadecabacter dasysiphoniae TaxID=2909341 RepID=A0ABS9CUW4_9RHOB|nr:BLUF domain-containing protein [Octadecabacter dasysiphoniae]MCF2871058.1 BLUF domain-containing protein [Octadecabacter dasysiphoniae]
MDLKQIIYSSQPFGYDNAILSGILLDARRCNNRDGITGALVCRHDVFLQLLEGPADVVDAAFGRIARDDRHVNITQRASGPIDARMFGNWDMLHDPAKSWLWSIEDIANGTLDRASAADVQAVFATLQAKVNATPDP